MTFYIVVKTCVRHITVEVLGSLCECCSAHLCIKTTI
jgi:hypothetical protein